MKILFHYPSNSIPQTFPTDMKANAQSKKRKDKRGKKRDKGKGGGGGGGGWKMKVEGALPNFAFCSCPNGAYKQSFGKSIGSVLKLSLGEVRELSSGSKKFLQSTEFTLEKS